MNINNLLPGPEASGVAHKLLRVLIKWGNIFIVISIAVHFVRALMGDTNIYTTACFYFTVWYILYRAINYFFLYSALRRNYLLLCTIIVCTLFGAELFLKYGLKRHLDYSELNGGEDHNSVLRQIRARNLLWTYFPKLKEMDVKRSEEVDDQPEFRYVFHYNSRGLRGQAAKNDTGLYKILGVGDSFTEGAGTPDDSTWLLLLQNNLNAAGHTRKYLCINGGRAGSDPYDEYLALKEILKYYRPQLVILATNATDLGDLMLKGDAPGKYNTELEYPWWEFFYQFSFIVRNIVHTVYDLDQTLIPREQQKAGKARSLEKMMKVINEDFRKLATDNKFKLVVVVHPLVHELLNRKPELAPLIPTLKQDSVVIAVNLFNPVLEATHGDSASIAGLYWHLDQHMNSSGYQLWADSLAPHILNFITDNKR